MVQEYRQRVGNQQQIIDAQKQIIEMHVHINRKNEEIIESTQRTIERQKEIIKKQNELAEKYKAALDGNLRLRRELAESNRRLGFYMRAVSEFRRTLARASTVTVHLYHVITTTHLPVTGPAGAIYLTGTQNLVSPILNGGLDQLERATQQALVNNGAINGYNSSFRLIKSILCYASYLFLLTPLIVSFVGSTFHSGTKALTTKCRDQGYDEQGEE